MKVVFHWKNPFTEILKSSSFYQNIEVVFHLPKFWSCLPFSKILRLSFIFQDIEVVFRLPKYWGFLMLIFYFPRYWGSLPFTKILRSSSIFWRLNCLQYQIFHFPKKNQVVCHLQNNWGPLPFVKKKGGVVFQFTPGWLFGQALLISS